MKKIIAATAILMALQFTAKAQVINGGMEKWSINLGNEDPDNWNTSNIIAKIGGDSASVVKVTDRSGGTYAAQLKSFRSTLFGEVVPGFMEQQSPITSRPATLRFMFKTYFSVTDTSSCTIDLYKGDVNDESNLVGSGEYLITVNKNSYTPAIININYLNATTPDTMIIFCTAGTGLAKGTTMYIDDIALSSHPSSLSFMPMQNTKVYPSPAVKELNVSVKIASSHLFITVIDITGKEVIYEKLNGFNNTLNISNLDGGIYTYHLYDLENSLETTGKFSVIR